MTQRLEDDECVGIDGCRNGWVVASSRGWKVVSDLDSATGSVRLAGIDIPIGLPDRDRRSCDVEARRFLSPRGATIFPAPCRGVLVAGSYTEANDLSRSITGRGLSRQSFALIPKIREADEAARRSVPLIEIHPECAFARMAGRVLKSKHSVQGVAVRARLIHDHVGAVDLSGLPRGCGPDDVLDAYAVLWSTRRFAAGCHVEFGDGSVDAEGLPMRIVS